MTKSTDNKSCPMWCKVWQLLEKRVADLGGRRGNRRSGAIVLRVVFEYNYRDGREVREFVLNGEWSPEFIQGRISDHLTYMTWAMSYQVQIVDCA